MREIYPPYAWGSTSDTQLMRESLPSLCVENYEFAQAARKTSQERYGTQSKRPAQTGAAAERFAFESSLGRQRTARRYEPLPIQRPETELAGDS